MKTPISYYGGKQNLVQEILALIPTHEQYIEPFFGGGAVFFAKHPSKNECINDLNFWAITFYECVKCYFDDLNLRIQATLHSEHWHEIAGQVLKAIPPPLADTYYSKEEKIAIAWAFWVQCNMSFGNNIFSGFAFSNLGDASVTTNKKRSFTDQYSKRLENAELFCRDAINIIKLKDGKDSFFYIDPPYVSSDQGYYKGYTEEKFQELLDLLGTIEGKFLMSSYLEDNLVKAIDKNKWNIKKIKQIIAITGKREVNKMKVECLTYNYQERQHKLFN
jgi:DNA adenine methylase